MTTKPLKDVGTVFGFDGVGVQLFEIQGFRKKDDYSFPLASAGDVDLDGYADIITASAKAEKQDPVTLKIIKDIGFVEVISGSFAVGRE